MIGLTRHDIYGGGATPIAGAITQAATTGAANFLSIPIGKTFVGTIVITCACTNDAAVATEGQATGIVGIFGAGTANPAANANLWRCDAFAGANAATGLTGDDGNNVATFTDVIITVPFSSTTSMTLALASTQAGSKTQVSASAYGVLI